MKLLININFIFFISVCALTHSNKSYAQSKGGFNNHSVNFFATCTQDICKDSLGRIIDQANSVLSIVNQFVNGQENNRVSEFYDQLSNKEDELSSAILDKNQNQTLIEEKEDLLNQTIDSIDYLKSKKSTIELELVKSNEPSNDSISQEEIETALVGISTEINKKEETKKEIENELISLREKISAINNRIQKLEQDIELLQLANNSIQSSTQSLEKTLCLIENIEHTCNTSAKSDKSQTIEEIETILRRFNVQNSCAQLSCKDYLQNVLDATPVPNESKHSGGKCPQNETKTYMESACHLANIYENCDSSSQSEIVGKFKNNDRVKQELTNYLKYLDRESIQTSDCTWYLRGYKNLSSDFYFHIEGIQQKTFEVSNPYPNPIASGNINIDIKQNTTDIQNEVIVEVFDTSGRLVSTPFRNTITTLEKKVSFNINSLASGVYLIRIIKSKAVITKKFSVIGGRSRGS